MKKFLGGGGGGGGGGFLLPSDRPPNPNAAVFLGKVRSTNKLSPIDDPDSSSWLWESTDQAGRTHPDGFNMYDTYLTTVCARIVPLIVTS